MTEDVNKVGGTANQIEGRPSLPGFLHRKQHGQTDLNNPGRAQRVS